MSLSRSGQQGITLVELVLTIIIMSIAFTAMISVFSGTLGRSADPLWRNKSLKLAQLYLDEILSKPFDESTPLGGVPATTSITRCTIGPNGEGGRAGYDDVDDYDEINTEAPSSLTGGMASYVGYRVSVDVSCAGGDVNASSNSDAKLITVTIFPPGQSAMAFSVYRGNF